MEQQDWNMIGADCIVLSCCCQCLMLQVVVFVLLKLPAKLIKKTKQYIKRKFGNKVRNGTKMVARRVEEVVGCQKPRDSMRVRTRAQSFPPDGFDRCMDEVEDVLEELSTNGEFGFGSFWRANENVEFHFPICLVNQKTFDHESDPFS